MKIAELKDGELARAVELAEAFGMYSSGIGRPYGLGAWMEGRLAGVCLGRISRTSHTSELMFVHVNGLFRGQGVARGLVERWKQCVRRDGVQSVALEYITGNGQSDPRPFLEALGFSGLRQGETLFSMRLDTLAESEWVHSSYTPGKGFVRLTDMSHSDLSRLDWTMRRSFPSFATLQSVKGELLPDLSWVFQNEKGEVKLSLLFSKEGEALYLHSLYCAKGWQKHLPSLLRLALSRACAQTDRYERIYVTCINESASRIVRRVVGLLPHQERTAWRMYMRI